MDGAIWRMRSASFGEPEWTSLGEEWIAEMVEDVEQGRRLIAYPGLYTLADQPKTGVEAARWPAMYGCETRKVHQQQTGVLIA